MSINAVSLLSKSNAKPFALVIFGASGNLTRRKLIPALFGLFKEKALPDNFKIIGFARREKTDDHHSDGAARLVHV